MLFQIAQAAGGSTTFRNPFGAFSTIPEMLVAILNILMIFAVPVIMFFLIFAGFSYVMARGNPEQIKSATRSLMYAVIGGVLVFGSFAISQIVINLTCDFNNTADFCKNR